MTFLDNPKGYTPGEFALLVKQLAWAKWKPKYVVLHNTALPNLAQWRKLGIGHEGGTKRVRNLNAYYKSLKWHSGPHLFIAPDLIWTACDLEADGVHASCYNKESLGVEMVGNFDVEAFDTGDGALVRGNTVVALAALHKALRISPDTLKFHRECLRDHHDCPGKHVSKDDMIARVKHAMST